MRKNLLYLTLAAAAVALPAGAAVNVTVTPLGENPAPSRMPAVSVGTVIVDENFDGFVDGTNDAPDWDHPLCSHYTDENIRTELTHGLQWSGHNVCMGGGAAALYDLDPMDPAYINTPKMDYSGSVTITFRARALPTRWEEEDENGNTVTMQFTNTSIILFMDTDSGREFDTGDEPIERYTPIYEAPLYENQGWYEVKIEFDNYSAYNDAFFNITSSGHLLVDDMKVVSSCDKFIASPVFSGYTGATNDSFTVSWEPVSKSFNYYLYLYEKTGVDEEGNPVYKTVMPLESLFSEEDKAAIEAMGLTLEEYLQDMAEQMGMTYEEMMEEFFIMDKPYNNCGRVDHRAGTPRYTYTYTGLDPEKQYYFDIRSHYFHTFSPENIRPVMAVGTPGHLPAGDITADAFTANWSRIDRADAYTVDLYGVDKVEEAEDHFIIFEEDFDGTSDLTDATDIANPEAVGEGSDITFDDLTASPGWSFPEEYILMVKGKAGLGVDDWGGSYRLTSPQMYVGGADKATISLCIESTLSNYEVGVRFAGQVYSLPVEGSKFEGEFELPTFGLEETNFAISGPEEAPVFLDYITVTQPLPAGAYTFTWLGREEVDSNTLSFRFEGLDSGRFPYYAYNVLSYRTQDGEQLVSLPGERMVVDLKNGSSEPQFAEVAAVAGKVVEVARYAIDGRQLAAPEKGINIVRYSDGSVRKVIVR